MLRNGLLQALTPTVPNLGWAPPATATTHASANAITNATTDSTGARAPADNIVAYRGRRYFPVSHDLQRLLSLETAGQDEIDAAFAGAAREKRDAGADSAPTRVRRYDAHTPSGLQHFFRHHARGSVLGIANENWEELMRLSRGEVTIAAGDAALHDVVRTLPAGTLAKERQSFNGWYVKRRPTTWHCVYPPVASGRSVASVTQLQADGSRKPVLVAVHANRHSYSLDRGRTWHPTGALHNQAAQDARADAWSRFFADRLERARTMQSQSSSGYGG